MTSAVQVLVIEKELTGCDLKMAAAPKSIILTSAEIVLFFSLWNQKTKWI